MLVLLTILIFVYHTGATIYYLKGWEPLPTIEFLDQAAFLCGVVWWLNAEAKRSAVTSVYCPGLLVGIGWLIIIPYHLLKTRGARGLIPLFALIGAVVVAHFVAVIFYAATAP